MSIFLLFLFYFLSISGILTGMNSDPAETFEKTFHFILQTALFCAALEKNKAGNPFSDSRPADISPNNPMPHSDLSWRRPNIFHRMRGLFGSASSQISSKNISSCHVFSFMTTSIVKSPFSSYLLQTITEINLNENHSR